MINTILAPIADLLPESNRWERIWKLAQVDFKKRYYNDSLGLFWALLDPILQVCVYYFAFEIMRGGGRSSIENFALFMFSAIIFWKFFAETMTKGMKAMHQKKYLIQSIAVNKLDLFLSNVLATFLALIFNVGAYILAASVMGVSFSLRAFLIVLVMLAIFLIGLGGSMIIAVIYIYFKDINHLISVFIRLGFWTSGIFFPAAMIKEFWEPLYYINPFVGLFENTRAVFLYDQPFNFEIYLINLATAIVILAVGLIMIRTKSHMVLEKA